MDEPDGLIDIFSVSLQGRPEITLNCQYEIIQAIFNPHNPNIVIGSTTSGYLLEWDIRAKKEPIAGAAAQEEIEILNLDIEVKVKTESHKKSNN